MARTTITIPSSTLRVALENVLHFTVSRRESYIRPLLASVHLVGSPERGYRLEATNSYVAIRQRIENANGDGAVDVLFTKDDAEIMVKSLRSESGDASLTVEDNRVDIMGRFTFSTYEKDGPFPNLDAVWPTKTEPTAESTDGISFSSEALGQIAKVKPLPTDLAKTPSQQLIETRWHFGGLSHPALVEVPLAWAEIAVMPVRPSH
jgi:DNA polymerase III sliding clamp (beta) subunit (PCNA family)